MRRKGIGMRMLFVLPIFAGALGSAFANPSCVDPTGVTYIGGQCQEVPLGPPPSIAHTYVSQLKYRYTCGSGETREYSTQLEANRSSCPTVQEANSRLPEVSREISAQFVDAYSGSEPTAAGFDHWTGTWQVDAARNRMGPYDPYYFKVEQVYPTISSAFPFDGAKDDPDAVNIAKTFGYAHKCRAALKITYWGRSPLSYGITYSAMVYVFPGKGDQNLYNKPLVVGDAFDPSNGRDAWGIYSKPQYRNLLATDPDPATQPMNSTNTPRAEGYDVWFIDFAQGGGDIYLNAGIELRLIQWLKENNAGRVIVGGPSMSGVVARTAMLYSMPQNNLADGYGKPGRDLASNVRGLLTIDSPHQGASISAKMQEVVYSASRDADVNGVVGLATSFGADQSNTAIGSWNELTVPAALEMLYGHYYPDSRESPTPFNTLSHDAFYNSLSAMGDLRKDIANVAIAYSNFHVPYKGGINPDVETVVGKMNIKAPGGLVLFSSSIKAGGDNGGKYEFYPGSIGNWYMQYWKLKYAQYLDMNAFNSSTAYGGTEVFAGTFIPIQSALGLSSSIDVFSNPSLATVQANSMFHKVYFMDREYNNYSYLNPNPPNSWPSLFNFDKRFEHIVFDPEVMGKISEGLAFIEKRDRAKLAATSIRSLLLN
jgi:hypothetical protein